jgi:hypothetical protein
MVTFPLWKRRNFINVKKEGISIIRKGAHASLKAEMKYEYGDRFV